MHAGRRQILTSVQARLTLVMVAVVAALAFALLLSESSERREIDTYLAASAEMHGELLDRALELKGGLLETLARDYSLWGEMVQFVKTGDPTWASVNIDAGMGTFQADAAWVFAPTGSQVYAWRDSALATGPEPLPPGVVPKDLFGDGHFCHYFISGPDGAMEVRGATIHPSEDDDRKTPVRGYFLVARSWHRHYVAELAQLTQKEIHIAPARVGAEISAEVIPQSGQVRFTRPLPGPTGRPELMLTATFQPAWIAIIRNYSHSLLLQLAVLSVLGVLGLTLVLQVLVTQPLDRLRRSLESGSTAALEPLARSRSEFGQLARLVRQFFNEHAALGREVAERAQAEAEIARKNAELTELNDVKNQLLGMAAHDLRNPLSVIRTSSSFLLEDEARLLPPEKVTAFMRRIKENSEFMLKLIDDLLDMAKIESGRLDLNLVRQDLYAVIEENVSFNRTLADKKDIRLDFVPGRGLPLLRFDRGKVEQVLNNLISNALKFSSPGTAVTVQAARANGTVVVSVKDQGPGIPAEELDRLFKPFSKTSVRSTAGEKGTGLGLAISHRIVEGHGGRIWAESEVGKGTTFKFSLPIS